LGEFYSQEAHYEPAVAQYLAALKKQPDAMGIHSPLGVAYWNLNQLEPAKKELLLAVQEAPDDPYANLYLGRMAVRDHDMNNALPYLKRAVASHVEELETRLLLGRCYIGLGELQEAKADLVLAAGLDPADPRSHYMLAEVYQKLNQPADRQRELDLFNKLSIAQKAKGLNDAVGGGSNDAGKAPVPAQ
jgi:predicted Zn-dependent protease